MHPFWGLRSEQLLPPMAPSTQRLFDAGFVNWQNMHRQDL